MVPYRKLNRAESAPHARGLQTMETEFAPDTAAALSAAARDLALAYPAAAFVCLVAATALFAAWAARQI